MQVQIVRKSKFLAVSSMKNMKTVHYPPSTEFVADEALSKKLYIGGHSMYEIMKSAKIVCDFMNAIECEELPEIRE